VLSTVNTTAGPAGKQEEKKMVTREQVEQAMCEMDVAAVRRINDGSGIVGAFRLAHADADFATTIASWLTESGEDCSNEEIAEYINETYPISA